MSRWLTVCLVALSCAAGEQIDPSSLDLLTPEAEAALIEPEAQPAEPPRLDCAPVVFTLGEGVPEEMVRPWLARWSEATGCALGIGFGGIPVDIVVGLTSPDEADPRGMTTIHEGVCALIELDAETWAHRTLGHELGHCLGAWAHAASGVMAQASRDEAIDAPSLELVCEHLACPSMRPEDGSDPEASTH